MKILMIWLLLSALLSPLLGRVAALGDGDE